MISNTAFLTAADCELETQDLLSAASILYPSSNKLHELREAVKHYLDDIRGLLANRGIATPTIGFIGDKNSGKSYLLRLLIRDDAISSQIPCGMGPDGRTEKLIWIGAELPPTLDSSAEIGVRLHDALKQLGLERDVTLVDIPGFNDAHDPAAKRANELALKSCQVKVLVFSVAAAQAERVADFARLAPGPIIIPVINREVSAPDTAEARKRAMSYEQSIRKAVAGSPEDGDKVIVYPAVIIPNDQNVPILEDPVQTLARFTKALQDAVDEVRRNPHLAQSTAHGRRQRFYSDLRRVLEADYRKISELLDKIERDGQEMPSQLVPYLLGSERAAAVGIRIWLRAEVMHRTPSYFFPLRSFIGLLTLTSRAWDSLLLAMGGSVPSLFKSLFSIGRSVRLLRINPEAREDDELERTVRRLALDKQHLDLVAMRRHLDAMSGLEGESAPLIPKPQIQGLSELRDAAIGDFEKIVSRHALPKWLVYVTGWLSLTWCGLLFYGPLKAVYGHHLKTLWRAVHEGAALTWTDFPAPPASTVMGWIILAFIPVFVIALLLQALAATAGRVKRCRADMVQAVQDEMDKLTDQGVLVLTLRDSKLDAARSLFGKVFAGHREPH